MVSKTVIVDLRYFCGMGVALTLGLMPILVQFMSSFASRFGRSSSPAYWQSNLAASSSAFSTVRL